MKAWAGAKPSPQAAAYASRAQAANAAYQAKQAAKSSTGEDKKPVGGEKKEHTCTNCYGHGFLGSSTRRSCGGSGKYTP